MSKEISCDFEGLDSISWLKEEQNSSKGIKGAEAGLVTISRSVKIERETISESEKNSSKGFSPVVSTSLTNTGYVEELW